MRSKGEWRAGLPADVSAIIVALLAGQAMIRGVDYLTGDRETTTTSLTVVEQAMPLWAWGVFCVIGGGLVLGGMWRKYAEPVIIGSIVLMATYGALSWGLFLKMVKRGTSVHAFTESVETADFHGIIHAWPWDGWRTPMGFLVTAVLWGCFAWGTRVIQRARGDGHE